MITIASEKGMQVAFNPAPMTAAVRDYPLDKLRLLFLNQVEASQLLSIPLDHLSDSQQLAQQFHQSLPDTEVVLTLGAAGAQWYFQGQTLSVPAPKVTTVDTTGAGDTFIGYYLHAIITGHSVTHALQQACAAGALCVQQAGASISIPHMANVQPFLEQSR